MFKDVLILFNAYNNINKYIWTKIMRWNIVSLFNYLFAFSSVASNDLSQQYNKQLLNFPRHSQHQNTQDLFHLPTVYIFCYNRWKLEYCYQVYNQNMSVRKRDALPHTVNDWKPFLSQNN